jgi:hypothetical protein
MQRSWGRFQILKAITVLDFTRFDAAHESLSMFAPDFNRLLGHWQFLISLSEEISRPILPHEEELDYLATQAVAEYLSNIHTPKIDAVIYKSAQTKGGRNIVLFNHAISIKSGLEINGEIDISDDESHLTVGFNDKKRPVNTVKTVQTRRRIHSELESEHELYVTGREPYGMGGEPTLELAHDSLRLITAESVRYDLDKRTIMFFEWDPERIRKF